MPWRTSGIAATLRSRKFFCALFTLNSPESPTIATGSRSATIQTAEVAANQPLCREHFRLTCQLPNLSVAYPGQFVHLSPQIGDPCGYRTCETFTRQTHDAWQTALTRPMLRRAFSIAGLSRGADGVDVEVIYRVVGRATRWMESLRSGDRLSVLGPLGNAFPIPGDKPQAWLVAGGVGLPPMLWLAEALHDVGKETIVFVGARSADLFPLTFDPTEVPASDARRTTRCCREFASVDAGVVLSTDDGTLGLHGHIGQGLAAYHEANPVAPTDLVIYTCGPERMMRFVAEYCRARDIECYVCMERAMACGTGLCQSCVAAIRDNGDPDGWRYKLCCRDGPVFAGADILWETGAAAGAPA